MKEHILFSSQQGALSLLDQRLLPGKEEYFLCQCVEDAVYALQTMVVRGAPAIGVTAAYACVLAARETAKELGASPRVEDWSDALEHKLQTIAQARPTAVNLSWAVDKMRALWEKDPSLTLDGLISLWEESAAFLHKEDIAINTRLGSYGAEIVGKGATVMTHCNAGALATGGFGTALGVIYAAFAKDPTLRVIANETRPFLQGARLTAYELHANGVPVTVACDNACGLLMQKGIVDLVVVGADRIAANGDTANKIGTYSVAVLAKEHSIPFYIAAPLSTIDLKTPTGKCIPIEERTSDEVIFVGNSRVTPEGVPVYNYAFDVTPASLISGIITEQGVLRPPYSESIRNAFVAAGDAL